MPKKKATETGIAAGKTVTWQDEDYRILDLFGGIATIQALADSMHQEIVNAFELRSHKPTQLSLFDKGLPGLIEAARQEKAAGERVKAFWQAPGQEVKS